MRAGFNGFIQLSVKDQVGTIETVLSGESGTEAVPHLTSLTPRRLNNLSYSSVGSRVCYLTSTKTDALRLIRDVCGGGEGGPVCLGQLARFSSCLSIICQPLSPTSPSLLMFTAAPTVKWTTGHIDDSGGGEL